LSTGGPAGTIVAVYDPEVDAWEKKADMPSARAAPASVFDGKIYVFGGAAAGGGIAHSSLFEYDPVADTWRSLNDMPNGRFVMSTSVVDGKIYLIGGSATRYPHKPYLADVVAFSPGN
jgi:N-acetylneuraminic acid mutarotase